MEINIKLFTYPRANHNRAEELVHREFREARQGVFGSNYELGPVGIGVNFELAYPKWFPGFKNNVGYSISMGFVADAKDNLDFYITEGRPTKNNVTFSASPQIFYVESRAKQIYNNDLNGYANQFGLGIGIIGCSVSSDRDITYRQWTLTGLGIGIDVSTGSWETYTKLYKIYGR